MDLSSHEFKIRYMLNISIWWRLVIVIAWSGSNIWWREEGLWPDQNVIVCSTLSPSRIKSSSFFNNIMTKSSISCSEGSPTISLAIKLKWYHNHDLYTKKKKHYVIGLVFPTWRLKQLILILSFTLKVHGIKTWRDL